MVATASRLEDRVLPTSVTVTLLLDPNGLTEATTVSMRRPNHKIAVTYPDKREFLGEYARKDVWITGLKEEEAALFFSGADRVILGIGEYRKMSEVARLVDGIPVKEIPYMRMQ